MIGLADKVPQRLAGVVGVVAVNGGLEPVVHQLLQDVSATPVLRMKKSLHTRRLSMASLDTPVSYRTDMARSRAAPASVICTFRRRALRWRPRGLYGFDIHQNPPDRGGRPEAAGRPAPVLSGSPAELRGPRPDFKMVFGNAQVHLGVKPVPAFAATPPP